MLVRSLSAAMIVGSLLIAPAIVLAKDTPAPAVSAAAEHAHDGGIIAGKIASVDYRRNLITVNRTDIMVMPSTQIQGNDPSYRAISDLKPGMSVEVYTSLVAGKYIAQIITLR